MKLRITASLLTLALVTALVIGGITTAWFSSKDAPPSAVALVTGTVDLEITGEKVDSEAFRWDIVDEDGCRDFTWTLENTGTKGIYLRARLLETLSRSESAWAAQQAPGEFRFTDTGSWATYVTYNLSEGAAGPEKTYPLFAGQDEKAGELRVWHNGTTLYVVYTTADTEDEADWQISQVHLAVADDLELIPTTPGGANAGNPQVGRFPFKAEFDQLQISYEFEIPLDGIYPAGALQDRDYEWTGGETLYIAAHANVFGSEPVPVENIIAWEQRNDDCPHWEYDEADGYWYYCRETVKPGEDVTLCLTGCPLEAGLYQVKLSAEAVQAHPEAIRLHWGEGVPCLQQD